MEDNTKTAYILNALASTKLFDEKLQQIIQDVDPTVKSQLFPFISWLPKEIIELTPEYAPMEKSEMTFRQLPLSINEINTALEELIKIKNSNGWKEISILLKPVHQLKWAVDKLKEDVNNHRFDKAILRIREINRFTSQNWQGWYGDILQEISRQTAMRNTIAVNDLIKKIEENAEIVEELKSIEIFFHGKSMDVINNGLCACCSAVEFYKTANIDKDLLLKTIKKTDWWNPLKQAIDEIIESWDETDDLSHNCKFMRKKLSDINKELKIIADIFNAVIKDQNTVTDAMLKKIKSTDEKMRKIIDSFLGIGELRNEVRSNLNYKGNEKAFIYR